MTDVLAEPSTHAVNGEHRRIVAARRLPRRADGSVEALAELMSLWNDLETGVVSALELSAGGVFAVRLSDQQARHSLLDRRLISILRWTQSHGTESEFEELSRCSEAFVMGLRAAQRRSAALDTRVVAAGYDRICAQLRAIATRLRGHDGRR
ncbi:MAG: hypothetical protein QOF82_1681 [Frankiales bacterium]|jgi:hypothetical protein|nr:hypothetical protein [Frankiales bacterium]